MILILFLTTFAQKSINVMYNPRTQVKEIPVELQNPEKIYFPSKNKKLLYAELFKPNQKKIKGSIIHFHGNTGNLTYHYSFIVPLVTHGYQVFMFDYQGYGKSKGKYSQKNILEDCLSAITYFAHRPDIKNTKKILFGQSLGGQMAVVAASQAQNLLDAVVIDSAFTRHKDVISYNGKRYFLPARIPQLFIKSIYDGIDVIDQITLPKLFIHSKEDTTVPFYMGKALFKKARPPKTFWEFKGKHITSPENYPEKFVKKVDSLINPDT
ncbi:alpha/beta hydrolase [bacterium]|nr:alpha/beta hydrolase [bacterium]MBT3581827.1 alpha/beta hydrolase [bacterium]